MLGPIRVHSEKHVEKPAEKRTSKRQNGESGGVINGPWPEIRRKGERQPISSDRKPERNAKNDPVASGE